MSNPASSPISVNDGSVLMETSAYLDDLDPLGLLHNGHRPGALGGVDRREPPHPSCVTAGSTVTTPR